MICQYTDLSQGISSDYTKNPNRKAGVRGGFDENRMHQLAEQVVEYQRRGDGEGVGGRSSKLVRPHRSVQTGKVDRSGLEGDIWIQVGRLRMDFTDR